MKLVISIDVEEEGLFSGRYAQHAPSVANVESLQRLEFISRDMGFPLTLLSTYHVAKHDASRDILTRWRDELGAELGAHLHPWNTPPIEDMGTPEPVRADRMPLNVLRSKMATLFDTLEERFGARPTSFRMGRWDFGKQVEGLLSEFGVQVDSSHAPLRHAFGGPDRFLTPSYDPYWLPPKYDDSPPVLEAPLSMVPVWQGSPKIVYNFARLMPGSLRERILHGFATVGAAGIQPVWYPAPSMRLAARTHRRRGGNVLVMFLHSSELMPGNSPHFPNEDAVARLVEKIRHFLVWLTQSGPIQGVTLSELWRHPSTA